MTSKQSHFRFLSSFVFIYFFAQAMSIFLLTIWLRTTLQLNGTETGIVFSANFIAAMCSQPIYGFVSDRIGERRNLLWLVAALVSLSGLFFVFVYVYAPLLKSNIVLGAAAGGACLGVTFLAGSYAIESYMDRAGNRLHDGLGRRLADDGPAAVLAHRRQARRSGARRWRAFAMTCSAPPTATWP